MEVMSTHWQGDGRGSSAPLADFTAQQIMVSPPRESETAEEVAIEPITAVPSTPAEHVEPLVRGRRSAALLQEESVAALLPATKGWPAFVRAVTFGLVKPKLSASELARRTDIAAIQRTYSCPKMIAVVQPLGGIGKTMCTVGLASTFGIHSPQQVLAWCNNETMGTLGIRTNANGSTRTVWDLLGVLGSFETASARKGELSYYTRQQGNNQFHVLASDEDPDRMKQIGNTEFNRLNTVVGRFYDVIVVDTGNNTRSENWLACIEETDQLVIPTTLKRNGLVSALRMIEQLESMSQVSGNPHYEQLVRHAVVLITQGGGWREPTAEQAKLRAEISAAVGTVIDLPYDQSLDTGSIIDWQLVGDPAARAFERAAATVAEELTKNDHPKEGQQP